MFLFPSKSKSASFGANLPIGSKGLSSEINEVGEKFTKTSKNIKSEIEKYKKINEFNKKLSASYVNNMHVMVDVSKLLNDYAQFFNLLKTQLDNMGDIGHLKQEDIAYLENLTRAKMESFASDFIKQSDNVKSLYEKYGQNKEAEKLSSAQQSLRSVIDNADLTYSDLKELVKGGGKKKKTYKKRVVKR